MTEVKTAYFSATIQQFSLYTTGTPALIRNTNCNHSILFVSSCLLSYIFFHCLVSLLLSIKFFSRGRYYIRKQYSISFVSFFYDWRVTIKDRFVTSFRLPTLNSFILMTASRFLDFVWSLNASRILFCFFINDRFDMSSESFTLQRFVPFSEESTSCRPQHCQNILKSPRYLKRDSHTEFCEKQLNLVGKKPRNEKGPIILNQELIRWQT